jgi:hypothetical protein
MIILSLQLLAAVGAILEHRMELDMAVRAVDGLSVVLCVLSMSRVLRCMMLRLGCMRSMSSMLGLRVRSVLGMMLRVLRNLLLNLDKYLEEAYHNKYRSDKDKEGELLYAEERHQYHSSAYYNIYRSRDLLVSQTDTSFLLTLSSAA